MNKTIWACALLGATGCSGPQGTSPSLTSIEPAQAYFSRTLDIQIGGTNTHFVQDKTTVDFADPNIQVQSVTVAGPTLLQVTVFVGPTDPDKIATYPKYGPHDVTITTALDQTETVMLRQEFRVDSPLRLDVTGGTMRQGSLSPITLVNLDYLINPFVVTPASPPSGPKLNLKAGFVEDSDLLLQNGNASAITGLAMIDVKAARTPNLVASGPSPLGDQVAYLLPAGIDKRSATVQARAPEDVLWNMAKTGTLMAMFSSSLYKIPAPPAGDQLVNLQFTTEMNSKARPALTLLPASGKWTEQLDLSGGPAISPPAGPVSYFSVVKDAMEMYAIVYDAQLGGGTDYTYSVTAKNKALNIPALYTAGMKADMPNKQIDLSMGPTYFRTPALIGQTDRNYFEFSAGMAGQIFVVTAAPNPGTDHTDVTLDVREGACSMGGPSVVGGPIDKNLYESAGFAAEAGKTYCTVVGISSFARAGGPYTLLVTPAL